MRRLIEKDSINGWLSVLGEVKEKEKNAKLCKYVYRLASKPRRQRISVNLSKLELMAKGSENVLVPGKVLGSGEISKSINITAIEYSDQALQKLKDAKCNVIGISEMVKKEGIKIIV